MWGPTCAACTPPIAATAASTTPSARPRHPACTTATAPSPTRTIGTQSAVRTASFTSGRKVTAASALAPACSPGSSTTTTPAPWTWCSQVVPGARRAVSTWWNSALLEEAGDVEVVVALELLVVVGAGEHVTRLAPFAGRTAAGRVERV